MSERRSQALALLSLLGLGIAAYLSWVKFTDTEAFCAGVGNCSSVQNSAYAYLLGIPVAYLGLVTYVALVAIAITLVGARHSAVRTWRRNGLLSRMPGPYRPWAELLIFLLALGGAVFSAYLTYAEIFLIRAICPWCVASFLVLAAILAFSAPAVLGRGVEEEF